MPYSFKGSISFGLVYIPITLQACVKANDIGFNMIDKKTKSRIKYQKTCVECDGRLVKNEDIVKGYEYDKGKYVILDESDLEKLKTKKDKNITIERFVNLQEIDPLYYDKCYYVCPTGGDKAFALFVHALEEEKKVGVAKCVLGTKESLVVIRAKNGYLLLNTLFFAEQIQKNATPRVEEKTDAKEMKLAKTIIESMTGKFNVEDYVDEYKERVLAAIDKKIKGKEIVKAREKKEPKMVNLMEALQASLKKSTKAKKIPSPRKTPRKTTVEHRHAA